MTDTSVAATMGVALLPMTQDDKPLLYELYASTRAWEMDLIDWDAVKKDKFLKMQFEAQLKHYQDYFPRAKHNIIYLNEAPIGRIYVNYTPEEIRLLDITLSPAYRNRGFGSQLMNNLIQMATDTNRPLRFYVWQLNHDAQRFYKRLGCYFTGEEGAYLGMEWKAG